MGSVKSTEILVNMCDFPLSMNADTTGIHYFPYLHLQVEISTGIMVCSRPGSTKARVGKLNA